MNQSILAVTVSKPNYQECKVNEQLVDSQVIINNKLFHSDILNEDFSLKSSNRNNLLLGGFIKFKNIYKFGVNKRNDELFEFEPINWRYPKFLVASNIKKNLLKKGQKVVDYFVVIQFKEWITKLPIGIINKVIGPIDILINQYEVVLYYWGTCLFPTKTMLDKVKSTIEKSTIEKSTIEKSTIVYTIDPIGCNDMDDAISLDNVNGRIGIHIIDIDSYQKQLTKNKDMYSSIYAPHKTINMFKESISLKENEYKNVITCWVNSDFTFSFEQNVIKVTKNITYDQAETELQTNGEKNNDLKVLFEKSKEIGKLFDIEVTDMHKMIEVFMIFYNKNICSFIHSSHLIYRNQELNKKAYYSFENKGHYSLKLKEYTHATSPIRRYTDLLIQQLFKGKQIENDDLELVNKFNDEISYLYKIWDNQKMSTIIKNGNLYHIIFIEFSDSQVVFECPELNARIYNKINYVVKNENEIEINNVVYKINEIYNKQLFLKQDQKHTLFKNVLIQF